MQGQAAVDETAHDGTAGFDLGEFAWISGVQPSCNSYLTSQISGPEEEGFGGWNANNETGWSNEEYDNTGCRAIALLSGKSRVVAPNRIYPPPIERLALVSEARKLAPPRSASDIGSFKLYAAGNRSSIWA